MEENITQIFLLKYNLFLIEKGYHPPMIVFFIYTIKHYEMIYHGLSLIL